MIDISKLNGKVRYDLGKEAGGPLYTGLFLWLKKKVENIDRKIYFFAPGGYFLYRLFKDAGFEKIEYLDISEEKKIIGYLRERDFFCVDGIVFDAGWYGENQFLIEQEKEKIGCEYRHDFYYFGIRSSEMSRKNLRGKHYHTYAYDFYKNYPLQGSEEEADVISKLFFGTSDEVLEGVKEYVKQELSSEEEHQIRYLPEVALGHLKSVLLQQGILETEAAKCYPEDETSQRNYGRWMRYQKDKEAEVRLEYQPKFSIILSASDVVAERQKKVLDTVHAQTYKNYELFLVSEKGDRNEAINQASGDYLIFLNYDGILEETALYEFAKVLNENQELDFIYSDEDKVSENGKRRHFPFFKPDWSPNLFMTMMYTGHVAAYRLSIVKEIGGVRAVYWGCQEYDMALRFIEKIEDSRVRHIPQILYHKIAENDYEAFAELNPQEVEAICSIKVDALKRRNIAGHTEYVSGLNQYRVIYDAVGEPFVSIIIPSKDHPDILMQCVNSIIEFTEYPNYEVIVVDNGSNEENKKIIEMYLETVGAIYLYDKFDFNFSKMCNMGVKASRGEYILLLNDDIELFQRDWLSRMVGQAIQKNTGAVGAKLLFPNSTLIQHAGVGNMKEGPSHSFLFMDDSTLYGIGYYWLDYDCIAVTGACLLVSRAIYNQVGGLDERLPVAYNDVDLCFKIYEAGYLNVIRNDVVAYHHESLSRGSDHADAAKFMRLSKERQMLYCKHPSLKGRDPYLNCNIHNHAVVLDLSESFDKVTSARKRKTVFKASGNVEYMKVADRIQAVGWTCIPKRMDNDELERYLVFIDPYDNKYRVPLNPLARPDVVDAFEGRTDLLYSGFECCIDRSVLRVDIIPYKIGIEIIDKKGIPYIMWSPLTTDYNQGLEIYPHYCDYQILSDYEINDAKKQVSWGIEEITEDADGYNIKGWAFCDGNSHYKYKKELILKSQSGPALLFEVIDEIRPDIANTFWTIHFLSKAGMRCHVYKQNLKKGEEYEVILRMRNHFDKADINDIVTGHKICRK